LTLSHSSLDFFALFFLMTNIDAVRGDDETCVFFRNERCVRHSACSARAVLRQLPGLSESNTGRYLVVSRFAAGELENVLIDFSLVNSSRRVRTEPLIASRR
jgi:hypothetical protein